MLVLFYRVLLFFGIFFLCLAVLMNFLSLTSKQNKINNILPLPTEISEIYDKNFETLIDLDDLKRFVGEEVKKKNYQGIEIAIYIDDVIRKKYFHQIAYISNETNWLLKVADYFFPKFEFLSAMDPKELAKKNHAICNQQAIVFQEIVKDYSLEYASIGFEIKTPDGNNLGHFASAVKVKNDWFYFDSNLEPKYNRRDPSIFTRVLEADKDTLKQLYPSDDFSLVTKNMINFRDLNSFPAKRGVMFQKMTSFFSNFFWIFLTLMALMLRKYLAKN